MSFISLDFLLFFVTVLALYWALRDRVWQNRLLLLASYVFYGWVHPPLVLLLGGITGLNYLAGRGMERWPQRKDGILALAVVLSIVNLCIFKYYGWFADEILPRFLGADELGRLAEWRLALPLGLSFYTFHNLSYTIEVYRERHPVQRDLLTYFLYGSFFPQLVAGPVERPDHLIPQLERPRAFELARFASGFELLLWGLFKKVALADAIAPFVDVIFVSPSPSAAMVWSASLGFTIQALADFSGYTDIARGAARMLGIDLMDNFNHPYLAATPMEFWTRWHISFSTWLRDYVYLPACFSDWVRRWLTVPGTGEWGPFATTSRALLLTMLASGIWHGSTGNYIVWGLYYFLIGTVYAALVPRIPKAWRKDRRWRWLTVPIMFCFTVFGMHLFREPSLARIIEHLGLNPLAGTPEQWTVAASMLGVCAYAALPLVGGLLVEKYLPRGVVGSPLWPALRTTAWAVLIVGVFASARTSDTDFIYFQF